MILQFTKQQIEPGVTALVIKGSIHCGPECARLEKQVDELIGSSEYRVIFDMAGVTHMDSAAIGALAALAAFIVAMRIQFRTTRYVTAAYWFAVAMVASVWLVTS